MTKQVPWNEMIYVEFCKLAMLNDFEKEILRTRIMGMSITQQAMNFAVSESTVHRTIRTLKSKYDEVQQHSELLPPRRTSKAETWMDTH